MFVKISYNFRIFFFRFCIKLRMNATTCSPVLLLSNYYDIYLLSSFKYFHSQNVCLFNYLDIQLIGIKQPFTCPRIYLVWFIWETSFIWQRNHHLQRYYLLWGVSTPRPLNNSAYYGQVWLQHYSFLEGLQMSWLLLKMTNIVYFPMFHNET